MRMTSKLRSAFTVYWVESTDQWVGDKSPVQPLKEAGYNVIEFIGAQAALAHIFEQPPHFIVLTGDSSREKLAAWLLEFQDKLPETRIVLLLPEDQDFQMSSYYALGVYDCLLLPIRQSVHLVRAVDRAAETNCWMYRREQQEQQEQAPLKEESHSAKAFVPQWSSGEPSFLDMLYELDQKEDLEEVNPSDETQIGPWLVELYQARTVEDAAEHFLRGISICLGVSQAVYLKYYLGRRSLLAVRSLGLESELLQGLGVNLNALEEKFDSHQLEKPQNILSLKQMVGQVLGWAEFGALSLTVNNDIMGVFVLPKKELGILEGQHLQEKVVSVPTLLWMALQHHSELIEARKRLHKAASSELKRGLLTRTDFLDSLFQEVSRARRTQLPVSLLVFYVESQGTRLSDLGAQDRELALRLIGQILREHTRVNDFVGQVAFAEFGVLLPHTGLQGAAIKAERLRRQLELADFSKVLRAVKGLRVSVGVSEYPSLSQDAEELFQSADAVLYNMKIQGLNRVCVADVGRPQEEAPEGLI